MLPRLREDSYPIIIDFIRGKVRESGSDGVVIGLSGGLDSAVVCKLCADAVGGDKVLAVYMPAPTSPPGDREICDLLTRDFGAEFAVIEIDKAVEVFSELLPSSERKDLMGNVITRIRMIVLFHLANLRKRVVMGTSNKSELLVGYFTKFGDGGADFAPIGDLYKTEVRELARRIGIPEVCVDRVPSAGLWEGQTDEEEIGVTYGDLDRILYGFELGYSRDEIVRRTGIDGTLVDTVWRRYTQTVHKRKMPLIPKIGVRTIGLDWRE